jgi:hypothetical protein
MARKQRSSRKSTSAVSHSKDLPPCLGPKLHPFARRNSPIEWLERLDKDREELSGSSTEGYVFKVRIDSQLYALKVVSDRKRCVTLC